MSLYTTFKTSTKAQLKEQLGKKNIHEVPELQKIVVAMGIGSLATRKGVKDFADLEKNLVAITGQKPQMILSKQSISNFKLREGMPVMLRVTLRGKRAYDFVERLVALALPRVRDFNGISPKKFDGRGNYSLGFPNQVMFPEINHEEIQTSLGIQVTMITSTNDDQEAKKLLESLGLIFLKL